MSIERNREYMERRVRRARENVDVAREALRAEESARDEFELRHRPNYPTPEQRKSIKQAMLLIEQGAKPARHMGEPLPGGVRVHGRQGALWLKHGAPISYRHNKRLWDFTPSEIDQIRKLIREQGGKIIEQYIYDGGVAFQMRMD